jgi:DNA-binding response OmpR family regulator
MGCCAKSDAIEMTREKIFNAVIVAENDALMRSIIRSVLLRAEQQVFPVADGLEAVNLARQFKARLVLLDIAMPNLNGLLACEAIRALADYAEVPIVMLTGYDDERLRRAARRLGAADFITKPFRPDVLLARLAVYLDMPARASARGGSDASSGERERVWDIHQVPPAVCGDSPELSNGRRILEICRNAERKS